MFSLYILFKLRNAYFRLKNLNFILKNSYFTTGFNNIKIIVLLTILYIKLRTGSERKSKSKTSTFNKNLFS